MLRSMKLASLGLACAVLSSVPAFAATTRNTTKVNFEQPVVASGKVLAPGEYTLERVDSQVISVSRNGQFVTLLTTIPATRERLGHSTVTLRKDGAGAPAELDAWYFENDTTGVAFKAKNAEAPAMTKPCVTNGSVPE